MLYTLTCTKPVSLLAFESSWGGEGGGGGGGGGGGVLGCFERTSRVDCKHSVGECL